MTISTSPPDGAIVPQVRHSDQHFCDGLCNAPRPLLDRLNDVRAALDDALALTAPRGGNDPTWREAYLRVTLEAAVRDITRTLSRAPL